MWITFACIVCFASTVLVFAGLRALFIQDAPEGWGEMPVGETRDRAMTEEEVEKLLAGASDNPNGNP